MSHSVHYIDLMQMFLGMPDSVCGSIRNIAHGNSQCEDYGFAVFDYRGIPVSFLSSLENHGEEQSIHFDCERASCSIPWSVEAVQPLGNGFPAQNEPLAESPRKAYESVPSLLLEGHPAQLLNFLKTITGEEALAVSAEEERNTIEIIMGIYKSSVTGNVVLFLWTKTTRSIRKKASSPACRISMRKPGQWRTCRQVQLRWGETWGINQFFSSLCRENFVGLHLIRKE